ncbi:MAG: hypothetical protein J6M06_01920, partial [Synergistaceae bacterium]|nr:hypothetical protein [Synergistaceae bacterium]
HSAAYAQIAYQTAYLKRYHPAAFFAALLTSEKSDTKKIDWYTRKMKEEFGITLMPPSVNKSRGEFTPLGENRIYYGLTAIKNIRAGASEEIIAARKDREFTSMRDFLLRVDIRKISLSGFELLIKSGACDEFRGKLSRQGLLYACRRWLPEIQKAIMTEHRHDVKSTKKTNMLPGFEDIGKKTLENLFPDTGTPFGLECEKESAIAEWPRSVFLQNEKEAFGSCVSSHPLDAYAAYSGHSLKRILAYLELAPQTNRIWTFPARISGVKRKLSKKTGKPFATFCIEDLSMPSGMTGFAWNSDMQENDGELQEQLNLLNAGSGVCLASGMFKKKDEETWMFTLKRVEELPEPNFSPLRLGILPSEMNGFGMQPGTPPLRYFPIEIVCKNNDILEIVQAQN